jgi:hypothetical protein
MNVSDQGWGGTGHVHVRYTINDNESLVAFFINRDIKKEGEKDIYKFTLYGKDIKENDKINIYLCCPPWSGWTAEVKTLDVKINCC